jgi:hypothetical protein
MDFHNHEKLTGRIYAVRSPDIARPIVALKMRKYQFFCCSFDKDATGYDKACAPGAIECTHVLWKSFPSIGLPGYGAAIRLRPDPMGRRSVHSTFLCINSRIGAKLSVI